MNRKTIGMLLGAAAGAGLIRHFLKKLHGFGFQPKRVPVRLKLRTDGRCGIEDVPEVELKHGRHMQWEITNPGDGCPGTVKVTVKHWTKDGSSSEPPVDIEGGNSRSVKPGQTKIMPAVAKHGIALGPYYYDVYLNEESEPALDPIVRIVL